jgi:hypothetical protein
MNNTTEQGWDQLQSRINQMLGKYVGQELHRTDKRPKSEFAEDFAVWGEMSGNTITAETKKF